MGHFGVALCLFVRTSLGAKRMYIKMSSLFVYVLFSCIKILFLYERFTTRFRFEIEVSNLGKEDIKG